MGEHPIPFALPDISKTEIDAVTRVLESRWLTTGAITDEFEKLFASAVGASYSVALNSCTAALHLSLEALGIGAGDAVFLPTYTFAATGEVVRYLGAEPVLVDIEPRDLCIDTDDLRRRISNVLDDGRLRPRAVIPVHYGGVASDLTSIWEIAREYDLRVVEDAAHAFPASHAGRAIGFTPPDIQGTVCFSFYATKTITTGEGGMVTTNSAQIAERIRTMSLHGLSKQAWKRYSGGTWKYDIVSPGYKYNLTDIASAIGIAQLRRADEMAENRRQVALRYNERLGALSGLELPRHTPGHAWHLYPVRIGDGRDETARNTTIERLRHAGIGTSMHFIPLHLHSYYKATLQHAPGDFPTALNIYRRSLSLPIYSTLTTTDIDRITAAVRDAVTAP